MAVVLLFILLLIPSTLYAVEKPYIVERVVDDLDQPWGLTFLPSGDMLVTEKSGALRIIKDGRLDSKPIDGLPHIVDIGQGGLLDVIVHPNYSENKYIYLSYSGGTRQSYGTEVLRGKLNLKEFQLDDVEIIFKMYPKVKSAQHFGSRMVFDDNGYLFITLGDRGKKEAAQDLTNHQGTVVRLNDDGSIPQDNPYVDGANGARREIYSFGHRNVQGIAIHPKTRVLWTHEHGPRGGDEVNILQKSANYGWPVITYGIDYDGSVISDETHKDGMSQPLLYWDPSIAPCGMMFYTGDQFAHWKGNLFVGALAKRHLRRIQLDEQGRVIAQEELLSELRERIRNVVQGPDGFIYILTDDRNGSILRLKPRKSE